MTDERLRLLFWTLALAAMAAAILFGLRGVARARAGRFGEHRADMVRAIAWVAAFLVAYCGKLIALGPEPLATWSPERLEVLSLHRRLVTGMLAAGALAALTAARAPARGRPWPRLHRVAGWTATFAGGGGLLTAALVLAQMLLARGAD